MATELVPMVLLWPILVMVAYCDFRYMRIPNSMVLISITLFIVSAPFLSGSEVMYRVVTAAIVLCVGFFLFALRLFGGGDVKMLAALLLFVPSATLSVYALGFSASMIVGIVFIVALRASQHWRKSRAVSMRATGKFPMGVSIALSGFLHPVLLNAIL
jgi:prepilin peptidase CpaA